MNPETNQFEELSEAVAAASSETKLLPGQLVRPDGSPVPEHWSVFTVGEEIPIKGYVFKVAYIGETSILFEPVGSFREIRDARKAEKAKTR